MENKYRFLNPSYTSLVDNWLQTHPESAERSSSSCERLEIVLREHIYVKYLCSAYSLLEFRETAPVRIASDSTVSTSKAIVKRPCTVKPLYSGHPL